jgi:polyribonucleotide nucleotidyltransferase
VDFLPLTVDYREKYSAVGRFPGGFFRREARPSETEILVMRLVDRALRPLFPDDYHAEVQLMIQ